MKKISVVLILCLLFLFYTDVTASAAGSVLDPRYSNADDIKCEFEIVNDTAQINIKVIGKQGITSRITVNVKLEKRALLGLIWTDVEEWNSSVTTSSHKFVFSKSVSGGTYRCSFTVTVEGAGGSTDVHTEEKTVKN